MFILFYIRLNIFYISIKTKDIDDQAGKDRFHHKNAPRIIPQNTYPTRP